MERLSGSGKAGKHLVLVGMRAAGKTTMGMKAAEALGRQFVDLDHVLEKEVFGSTINAFVDENGWEKFRAAEAQLLADVVNEGKYLKDASPCVIATGGGIIETKAARDILTEYCPVVWVERHIEDIMTTLEGVGSYRPGLGTPPREIYERRRPLYDECSDYVFTIRQGDENWPELERRFVELCRFAEHFDKKGCPPATAKSPVCVPITFTTGGASAALPDIAEAAAEGAGMVELRMDKLPIGDCEAALPPLLAAARRAGLVALVTIRPTWEDPNAGYTGEEGPRLALLRKASELGASYVDVEAKAFASFREAGGLAKGSNTTLVVSSHDFTRLWSMEELRAKEREMRALAAGGVVKIAQMAPDAASAARMLALLEECRGKPTVLLAMGQAGVFTRLLSPRCGGAFTFGTLSGTGRASAPGQPSARDMWDVYRLSSCTSSTKVLAVLGDGGDMDRRKAAALNAGFKVDGLDAICVSVPVDSGALPDFLAALPPRLLDCASAALAKDGAAWQTATSFDAAAEEAGVADTLVREAEGGAFKAYYAAAPEPVGWAGWLIGWTTYVLGGFLYAAIEGGVGAMVDQSAAQYALFKGSAPGPETVQLMHAAASC